MIKKIIEHGINIPVRLKKINQYSDSQLIAAAFCLCIYSAVTVKYMNYVNMLLIALAWKFLLSNRRIRLSQLSFFWALYIAVFPILDALLRGGVGLSSFTFFCYFAPLSVFLTGNIDIEVFGKILIFFAKGFAWFQTIGIFLFDVSVSLYYTVAAKILSQIPSHPCGFSTSNTMTSYVVALGLGCYLIELSLMEEKDWHQQRLHIVKILILFISLSLTEKRSFLISTVAGFMIVMVLNNLKAPQKLVKTFAVLVVVVVGVYALCMYYMSIGSNNAFGRLGQTFVDMSEGEDVSNMRWQWEIYMNEWSEGYEVFGIGWESFQDRIMGTPYGGAVPNGHNVYLQIKCEEGYVGIAIYAAMMLYSLYISMMNILLTINKKRFTMELSMWSAYCIIVFAIYCFTGNAIYDSMIYLNFFGAMHIASEVNKRVRQYQNKIRPREPVCIK